MVFDIKIDKFSFNHFNDCKKILIFNKKSSFNFIYDIFQDKFKILKKNLDDNFIKEFIRLSFFFNNVIYLFCANVRRRISFLYKLSRF